jgi:hypothetical protein
MAFKLKIGLFDTSAKAPSRMTTVPFGTSLLVDQYVQKANLTQANFGAYDTISVAFKNSEK